MARPFLKYPYDSTATWQVVTVKPPSDNPKDEPPLDVPPPLDVRKEIERVTEVQTFPAGEWITRADLPPHGMHFIQEGAVAIVDPGWAHRGFLLGPSDTFGEHILEPKEVPPDLAPFPLALRAVTDVTTYRLRPERYGDLDDRVKESVRKRARLCGFLPRFLDALMTHELFSCLSRGQILKLALLGEALQIVPRDPRHAQPAEPESYSFELKDRVWIARGRITLQNDDTETAELARGGLIESFSAGTRVTSHDGAWVVRVSGKQVEQHIVADINADVPAKGEDSRDGKEDRRVGKEDRREGKEDSREGKEDSRDGKEDRRVGKEDRREREGKLVVLHATGRRERAGITALGQLLVEALRADMPRRGKIRFLPNTTKPDDVRALTAPRGIFVLDAHDWSDADLIKIFEFITKVVHLSETSFEQPAEPLREKPNVRCVLLDERGSATPPDILGTLPSVGPVWRAARHWFGMERDHFDAKILNDPPPAYYPGTVRLRLTKWQTLGQIKLEKLPKDDRESLCRLGRAVTDRRIGVALGGGGALGFAHIALLEALVRAEVPIDMISGVSFGSLVAAFYAVSGLDGLDRLKLQRGRLQAALLGSSMIPPLVELYLLWVLKCTRLEDVPVPFFPVALNLETSEEFTPTIGSVARGIRISSALPGMLTPYLSGARRLDAKGRLAKDIPKRLVDGTTVDNVPEGVLVREGADYIIASDVIGLPPPPESLIPTGLPRLVSPLEDVFEAGLLSAKTLLGAFVGTVWPFARMKDTMRSMNYLTRVADDRDADFANKRFRPPLGAFAMWDFGGAEKIMDNSRAAANTFAETVKDDWLGQDERRAKALAASGLTRVLAAAPPPTLAK